MPDDNRDIAIRQPIGDLAKDIGAEGLPLSLRILLDDGFYQRVKQLSVLMAAAQGVTPAHLIGKGEACFAIINIALNAKLDPWFVANNTYQTPGGAIGHNGALVQSMLEQSGRFVGSPTFEYRGDWQKLAGKFERRTSDKGREFVRPTWTQQDAIGLGVIVKWMVRGEPVARVWPGANEPFWLTQCYPLNSPLWATDPKTQIAYLAIRRFARQTSPGILGAAAFEPDEILDASERARDVTPLSPPRRSDFVAPEPQQSDAPNEEESETNGSHIIDCDGETHFYGSAVTAARLLIDVVLPEACNHGQQAIEAAIENNAHLAAIPEVAREFALLRNGELVPEPRQKRHRATRAEMEARRAAAAQAQNPDHPDPARPGPPPPNPPADQGASLSKPTSQEVMPHSGLSGQHDNMMPPVDDAGGAFSSAAGGASEPAPTRPAGALPLAPGNDAGYPAADPAGETRPLRFSPDPRSADRGTSHAPFASDHAAPAERTESPAVTSTDQSRIPSDTGNDPDPLRIMPIPVDRRGNPDYRSWFIALLLPKLRQITSREEFRWRVEAYKPVIDQYKTLLEPMAQVTLQKDLDDIADQLPSYEAR
jgi:hypothetical protein